MKNVADVYPLTPTQAGILYHTLQAPQDEIYFQQIGCRLRGSLDVDNFKSAWDEIVKRHAALRTIFLWEGVDQPLQVVREKVKIPWEVFDWRKVSIEDQSEQLAALSLSERKRGFDLTRAPILRMILIRLADERYYFIWNFHHLLTDGWSTHLVLYEAFSIYDALQAGEIHSPTAVRPFRDYIDWLDRQDTAVAERYWEKRLAGFEAPTPVRVDRPVRGDKIRHGEISIEMSTEISGSLQTLGKQHRLTLNTLIQGAWSILLSRYSGEDDVVFGTTLSGRPAELRGVETMIGMFINTLPVRVEVDDNVQLVSWLEKLQMQLLELRQYEYSSLARVQRISEVDPGQPLFDSLVVFENYPVSSSNWQSLYIEDIHYREQSNYPLALLVLPGDQIRLLGIYDKSRFDEGTVHRMLGHLRTILSSMITDPDRNLGSLPLLGPDEYRRVVVEWNDTAIAFSPVIWVHEQITSIARQYPARTAIAAHDGDLTYAELDERANRLANRLVIEGARPGAPIGLFVERSKTMLVGILGILKAGCAYVPIDPAYPGERVAFILNDIQTRWVVTQPDLVSQLTLSEIKSIVLDDALLQSTTDTSTGPEIDVAPSNPAYIIYTSGSTGEPKGVIITHDNLFFSNAARRSYYENKVGGYLLLSSIAFDSSVAGIFWTLTDGGTLVLPAPGEERDIDKLAASISTRRVTHTLMLPSLYKLMLDNVRAGSLDTLRTVIVAGEACPAELSAQHATQLPSAELYNEYGPTEATVWTTVHRLSIDENREVAPIGRPIANARVFVLDKKCRPAPIGVPGELVIGGPMVSPGYWQRPKLTLERFSDNLFGEGRAYWTGDLVRRLPDGSLEFLGRIDDQIKIRGYRVELGEIENALRQCAHVKDALVSYRNGRIAAYVIAESSDIPTDEIGNAVHKELAGRLPEYMLPAAWVWLDAFPLTPNGKVDRKNLPEPDMIPSNSEVGYIAPQTETEEKVHALWSEILGLKNIGVRDDFFTLGGHSLLIIQLVSSLRRTFGLSIPLSAVMDTRTIAGQAERIDTLMWNKAGLASDGREGHSPGRREEFEI